MPANALLSINPLRVLNQLLCLQILWLADNKIFALEGLDSLTGLKELNLARNKISHVGDGIAKLTALNTLNLAHNRISSFKVCKQPVL